MLDLGFVRDHLPLVEEKLRQRGMNPEVILGDFCVIDLDRRAAITKAETLKAQRNKATEKIAKLKKEKLDATALINETKQLREKISEAEKVAEAADARLRNILTGIPNLPDDSVPLGKREADNIEARRWGTPPQFDFTPKPHWELGEQLGVLDLERAAKLTGARFAVYWDMGAKLERALMNFMLDLHTREHGYTEVLPPFLVNADSMYGTGQLPKFEADLFKVPLDKFEPDTEWIPKPGDLVRRAQEEGVFRVWEVDKEGRTAEIQLASGIGTRRHGTPWSLLLRQRDLYLIPTAEVPVTNLYRDETLDGARLPISLAAYTPCFRSEAGSYGKDVRGIIRQHQFQKVELVKFTKPEQSWDEHEKLTHNAEAVLQKLGLHYRVMNLSTADLGPSSAKTYDLEVWLPGQQLFREISSCSNFLDYQARRANIRYRPEGGRKTELVHTLNGSGLAIGRTWVAIVENYQQADGSVLIPEVLWPYIGCDRITAKKF
ncbi:MAG TPA: serine--tRNA ligase [Terriglobales bacterium]|jgi:seryl-tRNA synthetase